MRVIALVALLAASAGAHSQVEIKIKKVGPDHVRGMMDAKQFRPAREIALQCIRESNDAWCKFYAAQMLFDGIGGPKNEDEAFALFKASAEQENPAAQAFVGNMHFKGVGVKKDEQTAVGWWEKSAQQCNTWAQNAVARTYYDGEWVPKNILRAYYWISLAAYYKFPDADRGVEVVGQDLSTEQTASVKTEVQTFINSSGCGDTKPVVNFEP